MEISSSNTAKALKIAKKIKEFSTLAELKTKITV
jgi:hypothetical protein